MDENGTILTGILEELKAIRGQAQGGARPFLSIEEVAGMLRISPKTIRNGLSKKTFPLRSTKIGGRVLFRAADILAIGK